MTTYPAAERRVRLHSSASRVRWHATAWSNIVARWSPDGRHVLLTDGESVRGFDAATGRSLWEVRSQGENRSWLFASDGTAAALISEGGVTPVDPQTHQPRGREQPFPTRDPQPDATYQSAAFGPDGHLIGAFSGDDHIVLWDLTRHAVIRTLASTVAAACRGCRQVYLVAGGRTVLELTPTHAVTWDLASGAQTRATTFALPLTPEAAGAAESARDRIDWVVSDDGTMAAGSSADLTGVFVVYPATGATRVLADTADCVQRALRPDGAVLFAGCGLRDLVAIRLANAARVAIRCASSVDASCMAYSPAGVFEGDGHALSFVHYRQGSGPDARVWTAQQARAAFERPTLLADLMAGRPLPVAAPERLARP